MRIRPSSDSRLGCPPKRSEPRGAITPAWLRLRGTAEAAVPM